RGGVLLPAERSHHDVAQLEARRAALDDLAHRLRGHHLSQLDVPRVRPSLVHAAALVRVEREPEGARDHLPRARLRDRRVDEGEAGFRRLAYGTRGERHLPVPQHRLILSCFDTTRMARRLTFVAAALAALVVTGGAAASHSAAGAPDFGSNVLIFD